MLKRYREHLFDNLRVVSLIGGTLGGLLLPVYLWAVGVPAPAAFRWSVLAGSILLGIAAGWAGQAAARRLIRPRMLAMVAEMNEQQEVIREAGFTGDWSACEREGAVGVHANDELGQMAEYFNNLVGELAHVHMLEAASTELTETLSSRLDLEELSDAALALIVRQTHAVAGCVMVDVEEQMTCTANHGLSDTSRIETSDHVRRALATQEMQMVRVPKEIAIEGVVTEFRPRQVLVLPITFERKALGVVVLASDTLFGKDAMWILRLFAQGLGLALNNAVTHASLQRIAAMDPLTGVFNRRMGMKRLREEHGRAERNGLELGVAMLDIDHFKVVNDTYGHLVGDRVLAEVAERVKQTLRDSDILLRYGGEEFLVVLPGADAKALRMVAERIRQAVSAAPILDQGHEVSVTVSLGVTSYAVDTKIEEAELLKQADDALYVAKDTGRNKVVSHADARSLLPA